MKLPLRWTLCSNFDYHIFKHIKNMYKTKQKRIHAYPKYNHKLKYRHRYVILHLNQWCTNYITSEIDGEIIYLMRTLSRSISCRSWMTLQPFHWVSLKSARGWIITFGIGARIKLPLLQGRGVFPWKRHWTHDIIFIKFWNHPKLGTNRNSSC